MKKNQLAVLFAAIISMTTACSTSHKMPSASGPVLPFFNLEGHRGARGLMPENTLPSFYKAIDNGANTVELDVVISKDKQVVVSHDTYFNPDITTTPEGSFLDKKDAGTRLLYSMNYDSIKKYDVGLKPYKAFSQQVKIAAYKPLLSEVIDAVMSYSKKEGRDVMINIELKTNPDFKVNEQPPVEEAVKLTMAVVEQKKMLKHCYIQSFDFRAMKLIHKNYPAYTTAILIGGKEKRTLAEQLNDLGYTPEIYSPSYNLVDAALVKGCHDKGIKIIPWTVNTAEEMKRLIALGVDGIITDYPNVYTNLNK